MQRRLAVFAFVARLAGPADLAGLADLAGWAELAYFAGLDFALNYVFLAGPGKKCGMDRFVGLPAFPWK
jgi:hypothetical protein